MQCGDGTESRGELYEIHELYSPDEKSVAYPTATEARAKERECISEDATRLVGVRIFRGHYTK